MGRWEQGLPVYAEAVIEVIAMAVATSRSS